MPTVPSVSPVTGKSTPSYFIHTTDAHFVDNAGRTLILRGVNLSGADKAPVGEPSQILDGFWDSGETGCGNFTGRPLNLDDGSADVHLVRLRGWGFNMLRYVVTWEALEHAGPGKYDYEFMDYTVRVLRKCKEYGFKVYMDPHQDIWSRFSGGSGAPYWTLIACGLNPRNFTATQAAIVHCEYPSVSDLDPANLPAMIWSTNYGRLASQTLFTLFFAGRDFAPKCIIDGQNIQDYLQSHFINAMGELADRIRDAGDLLDECVLGWDSMNEPFEGFCGYPDLNAVPTKQTSTMKKGTFPTPAQSMRLGMGQAQTVDNWKFTSMGPQPDGTVTIDPKGLKVWADPETEPGGAHPKWGWQRDQAWKLGTCIWAQHGVWDVESGYVILPDYFRDILQTHTKVASRVNPVRRASRVCAPPSIEEDYLQGRCCLSTHYYDGLTLVTRHWNWFNADALGLLRGMYSSPISAVKVGEAAIRKSLQQQLGYLHDDAKILGSYPTIIGEIGIPYDMDDKKAYGWTDDGKHKGDFSNQQKALDASLNAADGPNALNYTIWNYCPDNSHAWGDGWNMEDLSVWSPDDLRPTTNYRMEMSDASSAGLLKMEQVAGTASATASNLSLATLPVDNLSSVSKSPKSNPAARTLADWNNFYDFLIDGTRAVKAFCRPFPTAIVGIPKDIQFNISKAEFKFKVTVRPEDALKRPRPSLPSSEVEDDDGEIEELATEIYVPLVHFASDDILARYRGEQCDTSGSITPSVEDGPVSKDSNSQGTLTTGLHPDPWRSSLSLSSSSLALAVTVSAGHWAVEGQTLKWWYPVPPAGAPPLEHTIVVKRAGGVIKAAEEKKSACGGLWEQWCLCLGESCSVM
ncbi:hypothetical protein A0H81_04941 [Grifola frondosa]|uniref:Uncharacterized protein n=1 Tax=Grifola frondosa TaxID=5627 RepID=A0A1C7MEG0_GRIFR|nr:hypothetical protein A0H81_04941 [Grifola frondosa]